MCVFLWVNLIGNFPSISPSQFNPRVRFLTLCVARAQIPADDDHQKQGYYPFEIHTEGEDILLQEEKGGWLPPS